MRVYLSPTMQTLLAYGKLAATVAVLLVLLSQAIRLWGQAPALQDLKTLTEQLRSQAQSPETGRSGTP